MRIEQNQKGTTFQIYLGDGKRGGYRAQNINEVIVAINHYWGGNSCGLGSNPGCPLCRAINTEAEAMKQGKSWVTAQ